VFSLPTLGLWFAGVVAFILIDLIAVSVIRLARAAKRLEAHVAAIAALPAGIDPATAAASLERLNRAFARMVSLRKRMDAAIAIIRVGPRIRTEDLPPVFTSLRDDLARLQAR